MTSAAMWGREMRLCRQAKAIRVEVVPGVETAAVKVVDVIQRRCYFPVAGVYLLRDAAGQVMFIGATVVPLGCRLRGAVTNHERWTTENFAAWTVTMWTTNDGFAPIGESRTDQDLERALIERHGPPWNRRGTIRLPAHLQESEA